MIRQCTAARRCGRRTGTGPNLAVPRARPTIICSNTSRDTFGEAVEQHGNENPAISRQMRNENRPRNGRHFAIHQLSTTPVVDAYQPMTIAQAPYPRMANTIETPANMIDIAGRDDRSVGLN